MTDVHKVAQEVMDFCDSMLPGGCPMCASESDVHEDGCLCDALRAALAAETPTEETGPYSIDLSPAGADTFWQVKSGSTVLASGYALPDRAREEALAVIRVKRSTTAAEEPSHDG